MESEASETLQETSDEEGGLENSTQDPGNLVDELHKKMVK
jgi:hypothetical protein